MLDISQDFSDEHVHILNIAFSFFFLKWSKCNDLQTQKIRRVSGVSMLVNCDTYRVKLMNDSCFSKRSFLRKYVVETGKRHSLQLYAEIASQTHDGKRSVRCTEAEFKENLGVWETQSWS
jgi:hypothetical protein